MILSDIIHNLRKHVGIKRLASQDKMVDLHRAKVDKEVKIQYGVYDPRGRKNKSVKGMDSRQCS